MKIFGRLFVRTKQLQVSILHRLYFILRIQNDPILMCQKDSKFPEPVNHHIFIKKKRRQGGQLPAL